jgi:hypothetical protein
VSLLIAFCSSPIAKQPCLQSTGGKGWAHMAVSPANPEAGFSAALMQQHGPAKALLLQSLNSQDAAVYGCCRFVVYGACCHTPGMRIKQQVGLQLPEHTRCTLQGTQPCSQSIVYTATLSSSWEHSRGHCSSGTVRATHTALHSSHRAAGSSLGWKGAETFDCAHSS